MAICHSAKEALAPSCQTLLGFWFGAFVVWFGAFVVWLCASAGQSNSLIYLVFCIAAPSALRLLLSLYRFHCFIFSFRCIRKDRAIQPYRPNSEGKKRMSVFADMVEVHGIHRPWRLPCKKLQSASGRQAMEATRNKARRARLSHLLVT